MHRALAMWLPMGIWAVAVPSHAEPRPEDVAAAQVLFDEAKRMLDEGQAADACPKLEESLRLDVGIGTRFHLARCYELTQRTASAWSQYLEVAAASRAAGQFDREAAARARAESLEPKLSRLTIVVPEAARVPGLVVRRNGVDVGRAQWDLPIPVDVGVYTVSAEAPGREPWQFEVAVQQDGGSRAVTVPVARVIEPVPLAAPAAALVPVTPRTVLAQLQPDPPELERSRITRWQWAGIVTAGAGVVSLGASGVLALVAKDKYEQSGCDNQSCPSPDAEDLNRDAVGCGELATAALVAGGLLVGGGLVLYFASPGGDSASTVTMSLRSRIGQRSASLTLDGRVW